MTLCAAELTALNLGIGYRGLQNFALFSVKEKNIILLATHLLMWQ